MMWWVAMAAAEPDAEAVRDAMADHWQVAEDVREAVMRGDLPRARELAAGWPRPQRDGADAGLVADADERLSPFIASVVRAQTLSEAASRVALLGAACGACHEEQGRDRSFLAPTEPPRNLMERHATGAAWMWAGLVGAEDTLFQRGATTFEIPVMAGGRVPFELQEPVDRARAAAGANRASAYGDLLGVCANCHDEAGRGAVPDILTAEMHDRYGLMLAARTAVGEGRRKDWQKAGNALATLEGPASLVTGPWEPWLTQLSSMAWRLQGTDDAEEAGVLLGSIAMHCGACHRAIGEGPTPPTRDALGPGTSGAALLWLSLLTAEDEAWGLGVELLERPDLVQVPYTDRASVFATFLTGGRPGTVPASEEGTTGGHP